MNVNMLIYLLKESNDSEKNKCLLFEKKKKPSIIRFSNKDL